MSKNWALVIGINEYNPINFSPLKYAKRDAELVRDFFKDEANFDEVIFFSDDAVPIPSPGGQAIPAYPSSGNLESFLHDRFEEPFLSAGDNCWFFFAGHGEQYQGTDYLIPIDGSARSRNLGSLLPLNYVRQRLQRSGADNVILITDACRIRGGRNGAGIGFEAQQGVIVVSDKRQTAAKWER